MRVAAMRLGHAMPWQLTARVVSGYEAVRTDTKKDRKTAMASAPTKSHAASENRFNWEDPFLLEDLLSEEERLIRDTARDYAQDKLLPRVNQRIHLRLLFGCQHLV